MRLIASGIALATGFAVLLAGLATDCKWLLIPVLVCVAVVIGCSVQIQQAVEADE